MVLFLHLQTISSLLAVHLVFDYTPHGKPTRCKPRKPWGPLNWPTATKPHWNFLSKESVNTLLKIGCSTTLLPDHVFQYVVLFSLKHPRALQKLQVTVCNYSASDQKRPSHTFWPNACTDCHCRNTKLSFCHLAWVFITSINVVVLITLPLVLNVACSVPRIFFALWDLPREPLGEFHLPTWVLTIQSMQKVRTGWFLV